DALPDGGERRGAAGGGRAQEQGGDPAMAGAALPTARRAGPAGAHRLACRTRRPTGSGTSWRGACQGIVVTTGSGTSCDSGAVAESGTAVAATVPAAGPDPAARPRQAALHPGAAGARGTFGRPRRSARAVVRCAHRPAREAEDRGDLAAEAPARTAAARAAAAEEHARAAAEKREKAAAEAQAAAAEQDPEHSVVPWLRQLGIEATEAREAAALCENMADAPLEERVKA